jgi:predicted ATPase/DNA-binding XRE family transcriptional regulator
MIVDGRSSALGFANLLRQHRLAAKLTQEELAERAGLSARGISDLERGARNHPHRETVRLLANALGLSDTERSAFVRVAPRTAGRAGARHTPAAAQFPVPLTPLIGRHEQRADVIRLLQDTRVRLVTLTGPGGVGKTRLALDVTEQVSKSFHDGAVFVDLAPLADPVLVISQIATALGVRESAARTVNAALRDFLRERSMLLVLDNFEHLLPAAPAVADLLLAAPKVKALVTSRAALRLRGERQYAVPMLRLPSADEGRDLAVLVRTEAVAFLVDRARAVQPEFELTSDNAAAVVEVCQRLDGLPLALELAAVRVKVLPVPTLLSRLEAPLPLLTGGARDAPKRQRALRDTIAWSHQLLGPQARVLFHRLAVFVGGWTLEAAEAVCNVAGDLDVLEGLTALADLSLIRLNESGAEPRYTMLETIREYARDQLAASGDESMLREAHATYFLRLAEQAKPHLSAAGQGAWLRRLEADHPNFRLALEMLATSDDHDAHLRLAANLGVFWWMRGHLSEGRLHLERALSHTPAPTPHRAEAFIGIGRIVTSQGDVAAGETWLRQGEALARSLNIPTLLCAALFELGQAIEYAGDVARAVPLYTSALTVAGELSDAQPVSVVLWALSEAAYGRGDLETAGRLSEETIALLRAGGEEFMLSLCLVTTGEVALGRDDVARATVAYQEALELALGIDMQWAIAGALAGCAALAAARDHHVAAAELLGAAATIREASHQDRFANFYHHAQTVQRVRAALGEETFVAAWEAGRAMSTEEAIHLPWFLGFLETGCT